MRLFSAICCCLLGLVSVRGAFLDQGKEFEYDVEIRMGAGTMDYAPHSSGGVFKFTFKLQTSAQDELKGEVSNVQMSSYVGPIDTQNSGSDALTFTPSSLSAQFTVTLEGGLFKEANINGNLQTYQKNIIKAWIAHFQINQVQIASGAKSFKSNEKTIHGICGVTYTVTSDTIYKSMNLDQDCPNRPFRKIDDIRGYSCDRDSSKKAAGLVSTSNTIYTYAPSGSGVKITSMVSNGAFISQNFEAEGASYISMVNTTAILKDGSPVSTLSTISPGNSVIDSLDYEFGDAAYKWDAQRDLKAKEPLFSSGFFYNPGSSKTLVKILNKLLIKQKELLNDHGNSEETVQKAHAFGIDNILPIMAAMDYDSLMDIYNSLFQDKSEDGIMKSNIFTEMLGNTGTSASAMVIRDLVLSKSFDNCRDMTRVLVSVPYHIRRPSKLLVDEYAALLNANTGCPLADRAVPLVLGHLVKMTCNRPGVHKKEQFYAEKGKCLADLGGQYADLFFQKYQGASTRLDKKVYLGALSNIGGGIAQLLLPIIDGSTPETSEFRIHAIWGALRDLWATSKVMDTYFPIYADSKNGHEVRIHALLALMSKGPTVTDMARIVSVLKHETDYELINFVYTKLEDMSNSILPCDRKSKEVAGFFLKYLKQFSKYTADYGFGVSKTYSRQFYKAKYGYAGESTFTVIGAEGSTTPLTVGMGMSTTLHNDYKANLLFVNIRIEGLAKGLIKKFKVMNPAVWKTAKLKNILKNEMSIQARPDQPVRIGYEIILKGTVAYVGSMEMEDGDLALEDLMSTFSGIGSSINHQRVLSPFSIIAEQPTDMGIPTFFAASAHLMFSLKASAARKQSRGLLYVDANYDLHMFFQGKKMMMVQFPGAKKVYGIMQDRVYHIHAPRTLSAGVNPPRKELKLSFSRPTIDKPAMMLMHAQTSVVVLGSTPGAPEQTVIVSLGPGAVQSRPVFDIESERFGFHAKMEYFDCEMDINRSNTVGRAVGAFMPYNKNPKTPANNMIMGMRQITSFLLLFPRVEKCGMYAAWSQSLVNPVRKIEVSIRGQRGAKTTERLFLRSSQTQIRAVLKAVGDTTRAYRMTMKVYTSPGGLSQQVKFELDRAKVTGLGIKPYKICGLYEAKYPSFSKEMFDVDLNRNMKMAGKALVQYGSEGACKDAEGEVLVKFEYSTTTEARETLKSKPYFKECMKSKDLPEWSQRQGLPVTYNCMKLVSDATTARNYKYEISFVKMTQRLKDYITTAKTVAKAVALPALGIDLDIDTNQVGNFLNVEATLKNDDKTADVTIKTVAGVRTITDYPLKINWTKMLRSLQFKSPVERLMKMGVIKICQATSANVFTLDKVRYGYSIPKCWTLMSGHCAANPSYAVFVKKGSGSLPMAMKAFIGGYAVEIDPAKRLVKVDGRRVSVNSKREYFHKVQAKEIFKITKWGTTYNIYSFLRVWIAFDGNFVNVVPAPSVKGQHCGLCGNYNRNKLDEMLGKDGVTKIASASALVKEYEWKC